MNDASYEDKAEALNPEDTASVQFQVADPETTSSTVTEVAIPIQVAEEQEEEHES